MKKISTSDTSLANFLVDPQTSKGIKELVKSRNLTLADIHIIRKLQKERDIIISQLKNTRPYKEKDLKRLAVMADLSDIMLQRAWKFEVNYMFHKFWTLPHCRCPKGKNEENWPTGPYERSGTCLLHNDRG